MLLFRKQIALIMIMALVLMWGGIYITHQNMKNMTLWSGNDPLDIQFEQDLFVVQLLGLEAHISAKTFEPQRILLGTKNILSRVLLFVEIKYNDTKEYLNKLRK
ncbi:MAG: hypothetical protein CVU87_04490 [Firmicutes bacterium HGW-Firmicutes-12]|jgi:hypothetical protein|nr:MAG: hypothetical protein CVU87_04490 [Firmicutes bacterium HGW-Firmicutes-12]